MQDPASTMMEGPESLDTEEPRDTKEVDDIDIRVTNVNLAVNLNKKDEEKLVKIGADAKRGYDTDNASRKDWLDETEEWLNLAKQVRESKTFPWRDASNIKYPLVSVASLQFSARSYPSLVPADGKLVKTRIIGKDPDGEKSKKGERIATYMSWQFMYDMENWDEDMDRMLIMLPVCGMMFKKTYYDRLRDKIVSKLIYPENFVVDYWASTIEEAERISEVIYITKRDYEERVANGEYIKQELGDPTRPAASSGPTNVATDDAVPYTFIIQSTWLDLDEDGVKEPYSVTFHYESAKVVSINARYIPAGIKEKDGKIISIEPLNFYTKFSFIPNPDGSFYDLGFGHLLGPINEAVNTLVNQLVDAGHLYTLQSGFIGKGLRLKLGEQTFKPGEWKAVNASGEDLHKQIVPLPLKEPSQVLFQLLGMLITSGKELASVAEIFVGKMPGQNTPATTTMATIEQGMKVFTAIYKRVYRSLQKEFKKVYQLNSYFLDPNTYSVVLDEQINPDDFNDESYDICPTADPVATTQTEKLLKAQALMELLPSGLLDPMKVIQRVLQAQEQPNWEELIPGMKETGQPQPPQQKPDPKLQEMQMNMQLKQKETEQKLQFEAQKQQMDMRSKEFEASMKAQEMADKRAHEQQMLQLKGAQAVQNQKIFMAESALKMNTAGAQHEQDMKLMKEKGDLQSKQLSQKKTGSSGKPASSQKPSKKK